MPKFPVDAPKARVVATLQALGFNHSRINGATLRTICRQSAISREDFLRAYENS